MIRPPLTTQGAQKLRTEVQKLKSVDRPRIINAIAEAGITLGFGDGTFRPGVGVSRQQMATFLAGR